MVPFFVDSYRQNKDATSTKTVTTLEHCNSSLTVFTLARQFIQFDNSHTLDQDRNTFKLVRFKKFLVVAEVASFVGNPVLF